MSQKPPCLARMETGGPTGRAGLGAALPSRLQRAECLGIFGAVALIGSELRHRIAVQKVPVHDRRFELGLLYVRHRRWERTLSGSPIRIRYKPARP
jgi:hypothetical protein